MARLYPCPGAAERGSALPVSRRSRAWLGSTRVQAQPGMARLYRCPGAAGHGSALPVSRRSRAWLGSTGVQAQPGMVRLCRFIKPSAPLGFFVGAAVVQPGMARRFQRAAASSWAGARSLDHDVSRQGFRALGRWVCLNVGVHGASADQRSAEAPSAGCGLPVRRRKRVLARVGGGRRGGKSQTGTALAPLPPSSRGSVPCPI